VRPDTDVDDAVAVVGEDDELDLLGGQVWKHQRDDAEKGPTDHEERIVGYCPFMSFNFDTSINIAYFFLDFFFVQSISMIQKAAEGTYKIKPQECACAHHGIFSCVCRCFWIIPHGMNLQCQTDAHVEIGKADRSN